MKHGNGTHNLIYSSPKVPMLVPVAVFAVAVGFESLAQHYKFEYNVVNIVGNDTEKSKYTYLGAAPEYTGCCCVENRRNGFADNVVACSSLIILS